MWQEPTDVELRRRLDLRNNSRRVLCKQCRKPIPEPRRVFCSERCKTKHGWAFITELRREVRLTVRAMKTVTWCECGEALDTRVRPGPVPTLCTRCYAREQKRRYRARQRTGRGVCFDAR